MNLETVKNYCQKSYEGKDALEIFKQSGVRYEFKRSGMPASYDAKEDLCTLNATLKVHNVASYFVHEMVHVKRQKLGQVPNVKTTERDKYIALMVNEELLATVQQYQHYLWADLFANGIPPGTPESDMPPRYLDYKSAFRAGQKKAEGKSTDTRKLYDMAVANANSLLRIYILDRGLGVGAESYALWYAKEWKENNP